MKANYKFAKILFVNYTIIKNNYYLNRIMAWYRR